jgi:hypothetical protein
MRFKKLESLGGILFVVVLFKIIGLTKLLNRVLPLGNKSFGGGPGLLTPVLLFCNGP